MSAKLSPARKRYTVEEWKAEFKIGDFLCGWATGKTIRITAIGKKNRFLAVNSSDEETVSSIDSTQGWVKVPHPVWWPEDEKTR